MRDDEIKRRDEFTKVALAALIQVIPQTKPEWTWEEVAKLAVGIADGTMKTLENYPPK